MFLNVVPSIQSFLDHANTIGFFLHRGRFVNKLAASIPPTEVSPLPASLVHATYLIGVMCTNEPILKPMSLEAVYSTYGHVLCARFTLNLLLQRDGRTATSTRAQITSEVCAPNACCNAESPSEVPLGGT